MKKFFIVITLFFSSCLFSKDLFKIISIEELSALMKNSPANIFIYDANVESTRTHVGIIPGAILIDSSGKYDVASVLPPQKNSRLVFYCANKMCTSSHLAATRAIEAGYSDVSVLTEGIFGWKGAKKEISIITREPQSEKAASVEPKEAEEMVKKNKAVIVDVRENEERFEIVTGALWAPMSKINDPHYWTDFKKNLPKNKIVIFYCASGIRSKKMAEKTSSEGYNSLYFKSADQWKAAGLAVSKGPAAR